MRPATGPPPAHGCAQVLPGEARREDITAKTAGPHALTGDAGNSTTHGTPAHAAAVAAPDHTGPRSARLLPSDRLSSASGLSG